MLARGVLSLVAQFRVRDAAAVSLPRTDIALAVVNHEAGDINESHLLSFLLQMRLDSPRQLRRLRHIRPMLFISRARREQQDIVLRFEMANQTFALYRGVIETSSVRGGGRGRVLRMRIDHVPEGYR